MLFNKSSVAMILSLTSISSSCNMLVVRAESPQTFEEFRNKYNSKEYLTKTYNDKEFKVRKRVFQSKNDKNILTIELHYLDLHQTTTLINDFIELVNKGMLTNYNFKKVKIITGQGKHSPGSKSVLKPAVFKVLRDENWFIRISSENEGMIEFLPIKVEKPIVKNQISLSNIQSGNLETTTSLETIKDFDDRVLPSKESDQVCSDTLNAEVRQDENLETFLPLKEKDKVLAETSEIISCLKNLQSACEKYFDINNEIIKIKKEIEDITPGKKNQVEQFDSEFNKKLEEIFCFPLECIEQGLWYEIGLNAISEIEAETYYEFVILRNLNLLKALGQNGYIYSKEEIKREGCVEIFQKLTNDLNEEIDKLKKEKDISEKEEKSLREKHEQQVKLLASLDEDDVSLTHSSPTLKSFLSAPTKEINKIEETQLPEIIKELLRQVGKNFQNYLKVFNEHGKKIPKKELSRVCEEILKRNNDLKNILNTAKFFAQYKKNCNWNNSFIRAFSFSSQFDFLGSENEKSVVKQLNDLINLIDVEKQNVELEIQKEKEKRKIEAKIAEEEKSKLFELKASCKEESTQEELLNQLPNKFEDFLNVLNDINDGLLFNGSMFYGFYGSEILFSRDKLSKNQYCEIQKKIGYTFYKIRQSAGYRNWEIAVFEADKKSGIRPQTKKGSAVLNKDWQEYCFKWDNNFINSWKENGSALTSFLKFDRKNLKNLVKTIEEQTLELIHLEEKLTKTQPIKIQSESKEELINNFKEKLSKYTKSISKIINSFSSQNVELSDKIKEMIKIELDKYAGTDFNDLSYAMKFSIWKNWYAAYQQVIDGNINAFSQFIDLITNEDFISKAFKNKSLTLIQDSINIIEYQIQKLEKVFPDCLGNNSFHDMLRNVALSQLKNKMNEFVFVENKLLQSINNDSNTNALENFEKESIQKISSVLDNENAQKALESVIQEAIKEKITDLKLISKYKQMFNELKGVNFRPLQKCVNTFDDRIKVVNTFFQVTEKLESFLIALDDICCGFTLNENFELYSKYYLPEKLLTIVWDSLEIVKQTAGDNVWNQAVIDANKKAKNFVPQDRDDPLSKWFEYSSCWHNGFIMSWENNGAARKVFWNKFLENVDSPTNLIHILKKQTAMLTNTKQIKTELKSKKKLIEQFKKALVDFINDIVIVKTELNQKASCYAPNIIEDMQSKLSKYNDKVLNDVSDASFTIGRELYFFMNGDCCDPSSLFAPNSRILETLKNKNWRYIQKFIANVEIQRSILQNEFPNFFNNIGNI